MDSRILSAMLAACRRPEDLGVECHGQVCPSSWYAVRSTTMHCIQCHGQRLFETLLCSKGTTAMISIVIPGRNDGFGYNLHKRVAISLNCFAANMRSADDENVFVDCNTSDGLPTLPEAIADTLTDEAKSRLRILRVRPAALNNVGLLAIHGIPMIVAHNVGFRRSNPANRWIAATTSDHVVLPRAADASVDDILADLEDGYYALPRCEVPQFVWEELNRSDPHHIFLTLRDAAESLHLREAVFDRAPVELDNVGDFQLVLRHDLLAVSGLDERMITGWLHTDANLHVRLRMLRGFSTGLDGILDAYHCSHKNRVGYRIDPHRQRLGLFRSDEVSFRTGDFLGLGNMSVEEIRLGNRTSTQLVFRVRSGNGSERLCVTKGSVFDAVTYPARLVTCSRPTHELRPNARISCLGANRDMAKASVVDARMATPAIIISSGPFEELPRRNHHPATTVLHQAAIFTGFQCRSEDPCQRDMFSAPIAGLCSTSTRRSREVLDEPVELKARMQPAIRAVLSGRKHHTTYEAMIGIAD